MKRIALLLIASCVFFSSCHEDYTPKPKGFFRIDLPPKAYRDLVSDCPFTFEYPNYAEIIPDKDPRAESCWINMEFPQFKSTLHISYKPVNNNLRDLTEDSRTLAMKHTIRAEAINENLFVTPNNIYGVMYDIEGNAASSTQFYLTDSAKHFLRASLYFNVTPNADSIAPVEKFINQDIARMIDSFRWKN